MLMHVSRLSKLVIKSPDLWDTFDLDCVLGKGKQLFKVTDKYRNLGIGRLTTRVLCRRLLLSIAEIKNFIQQIGAGVLLIVSNYILGLI